MNEFNQFELSSVFIDALDKLGITKPTEIQEKAIPVLKKGEGDLIGLSQTGTGKTLAFGLPLLELVDDSKKAIQGLILAPTRELAQQIEQQLATICQSAKKLNIEVVYGGVPIQKQMKALKSAMPQVIVATPGRLIDLLKRKSLKLDEVEYLVLDEADEMLNMGFKDELENILEFTPETKKTWLFSATMPKEIRSLVKNYMTDPYEVRIDAKNVVNTRIAHQYIYVKREQKQDALIRILDSVPDLTGIIFSRTKAEAQDISESLNRQGYAIDALHGDLNQTQRDRVMARFKSGFLKVIVATDVAARGIDVQDLSHVIHLTAPDDVEYYTHRSGRTGRAGKSGISLVIASKSDVRKIELFERKLKIKFEKVPIPEEEQILQTRMHRWVERILHTELKEGAVAPELLTQIEEKLDVLDKKTLIEHLVVRELQDIDTTRYTAIEDPDERKPKGGKAGMLQFFINIGKIDGFNRKELAEQLTELTEVPFSKIDIVALNKNHSLFEVPKDLEKQVMENAKGLEFGGRAVRINVEKSPKRASEFRSNERRGGRRGTSRHSKAGGGGKRRY